MAEIKVFNGSGQTTGTVTPPEKLAKANAKLTLVHQVAVAEMAGRRQGTAKTKRRDEVAGSGVKVRRQKGTGRSRQGDKRVPHFRGGGVVHGPKPRDYHQDTPRKMRQAAFRTALNSRLQNDRLFVLEDFELTRPSTKQFAALLGTLGLNNYKLLVLVHNAENLLQLSARNLPKVQVQTVGQTSLTDVLRSEAILCTRLAWDELSTRVEGKGSSVGSVDSADTASEEVAA
ncbi:MAG: 50S ribosomal protein L4 [Armatimonadota bacterium]|nr:50S ribosomal protein L4 [Armatimonadota bacterium]